MDENISMKTILNSIKELNDNIGEMQLILCATQRILKDFDARIKSLEDKIQ